MPDGSATRGASTAPTGNLIELVHPPHNIGAEQAFLGAALVDNGLVERSRLVPEDFYEPIHGVIWRWIVARLGDGLRADHVTARGMFDGDPAFASVGGAAYLVSLARSAETLTVAVEYARHIRELALRRRLVTIGRDIAERAFDQTDDALPDELAALALAQLEALPRLELARPVPMRELVCRIVDDLERPVQVLRTGIAALDHSLGGGLWLGKLYGIAARMKIGKTTLLATMARNVARAGHQVIYVALEMGQVEVAQRLAADSLGVNSARFLSRDDPDLAARAIGLATSRDAGELDNLRFIDAPSITLATLRARLAEAILGHRPQLVALDYWQLVGGCQRGQTEALHLGNVAQWLADFARQHRVAVLTAAQINRQGETRGSDGLRMAADWYAHLHPAEPDTKTDRWLEVLDSRYNARLDAGDRNNPALRIDRVGPVMRDWM